MLSQEHLKRIRETRAEELRGVRYREDQRLANDNFNAGERTAEDRHTRRVTVSELEDSMLMPHDAAEKGTIEVFASPSPHGSFLLETKADKLDFRYGRPVIMRFKANRKSIPLTVSRFHQPFSVYWYEWTLDRIY